MVSAVNGGGNPIAITGPSFGPAEGNLASLQAAPGVSSQSAGNGARPDGAELILPPPTSGSGRGGTLDRVA